MAPDFNLSNSRLRKSVFLTMSGLLALGACTAAWVNMLTYSPAKFPVVLIEAIVAMIFGYLLVQTLRHQQKPWHNSLLIYTYIFIIVVAHLGLKPGNTVINWWFSFPLLSFFLLSHRHALVVSSLMLALATGLLIYTNVYDKQIYWFAGIVNLAFPYLIILLVSYVYEKMRLQHERELIDYALTDPLTKAYNRLALKNCFAQYQESQTPFSLLLIDLDRFKSINDSLGHDAGDHVLIEVKELFCTLLPKNQVFRIGGEEFVLILEGSNEVNLQQAKRLREAVETMSVKYQEHAISITLSGGYVQDDGGNDLSSLLKQADNYLYIAKEQGRNCIVSE